jgi:teichuronic acid biosynthesis protein TuaE
MNQPSIKLNSICSLLAVEKMIFYIVIVAGLLGSGVFSFSVGPFSLFPYRFLLIGLWLLFIVRHLISIDAPLLNNNVRNKFYFIIFWLFYAIISLQWSRSTLDAVRYIIFLFMGCSMLYFMVYYIANKRSLSMVYLLWFLFFCAMIILGFWEHLTGMHLSVASYNEDKLVEYRNDVLAKVINMPAGVFTNPNDYATYLALSIPFGLGLIKYSKIIFVKILSLFTILSAFYLIVITFSRANIIAVILEFIILLIFYTNIKQKFMVTFVISVLSIVVVVFLPDLSETVSGRFINTFSSINSSNISDNANSMGIRSNLIKNCLVFLCSTGGFGVGAGNAEYWMNNFAVFNTYGIINPHNWWLEILTDYGVFVFAGYTIFYFVLIWDLFKAHHELLENRSRMIAETLLLALISFSIASISSSSIMAMNAQWILFAFALAFINWHRSTSSFSNR